MRTWWRGKEWCCPIPVPLLGIGVFKTVRTGFISPIGLGAMLAQAASALLIVGVHKAASHPLGHLQLTSNDIKSYRGLDIASDCFPTGGTAADGHCDDFSGGGCNVFTEFTENGNCSLPAAGCTSGSCKEDEICALANTCVPLGSATLMEDNDTDSPYVGVLTYDSQEFFLVGEKDDAGRTTRITEATTYSAEADIGVHIVYDESGRATSAYFDGRDEVVDFVYDDDGNLVSATESIFSSRSRRGLGQSEYAGNFFHLQAAFRDKPGKRSLVVLDDDCFEDCQDLTTAAAAVVASAAACGGLGFFVGGPLVALAFGIACSIGTGLVAVVASRDCYQDCITTPSPVADPTEAPVDTESPTTSPPATPAPSIISTPTPVPTPVGPTAGSSPAPVCPPGSAICQDPHLQGLRGQSIEVSGENGGWYCLIKDEEINFHVNVRFTAPLPEEFSHRQLITGVSVLSEGHSLEIVVKDAYSVVTSGCPDGISPCPADGGLRIAVDGQESDDLLAPTRHEHVLDGVEMSASNLPVECWEIGGRKTWARMHKEFLQGRRSLQDETFEEWVLKFDGVAAHAWCEKFISERGLANVQSSNAVFRISTPSVTVRLNVGVNQQGDREMDGDGRVLPDLQFWEMAVGFDGLSLEHEFLSGMLGETARPMVDKEGREVMKGGDALRGTVEDYRVSGPLGEGFAPRQ